MVFDSFFSFFLYKLMAALAIQHPFTEINPHVNRSGMTSLVSQLLVAPKQFIYHDVKMFCLKMVELDGAGRTF